MTLARYGVENFRCFQENTDLELRPLTVLLGKNNSGKSALARVPLFLAAALKSRSSAPIDLDEIGHDPTLTFLDLLYGRRPHGSLSMHLAVDTAFGITGVSVRLQNIDEYRMQVVREFSLQQGALVVQLAWDGADPRRQPLTYIAEGSGVEEELQPIEINFRGLLPDTAEGQRPFRRAAVEAFDAVRQSFDDVRYLGPFRDRPQRLYRTPSGMPAVVGDVGSDAPAILASDFLRGAGEILEAVNQRLFEGTSSWTLRLDPTSTHFSLQLVSRVDESLVVNFADTGVGLSQVLPILVQVARDEHSGSRPSLNIVEQPELHLHPAAHAGLADLYIRSAETSAARFLIETHSENIVLRIRRRIAEGLDPALVAMYFVEHDGVKATLTRMPIDAEGRVSNWPLGVFSEDVREVRAINIARSESPASD